MGLSTILEAVVMPGQFCEGLNGGPMDKEALSMKVVSSRSAILAIAALGLVKGAMPVSAGERDTTRIAPLKGVSLDLGSKNAVAYFVQENGTCSVTVTMAEAFPLNPAEFPTGTRVTMNVAPGTSSRIDTAEGTALNMACATGASSLTLHTFERTAYSASQQNY